jgi:hypothetical protein
MDRATDCEGEAIVRSSTQMNVTELSQRIEALCRRARAERPDTRLLVEIEDLLAEGYLCALHWDHHNQRLQKELDALLDAGSADELRAVAREQRRVMEAARDLRSRLAVMREHWVALGSDRIGLA